MSALEGTKNSSGRLKEVFKQFTDDKKRLEELLVETDDVMQHIQEKLTKNVDDEKFKQNVEFLLQEGHELGKILQQEPGIIVVGQTKSGKSSLINELLESTVVTADQCPCTARLTQLEYAGEEPPCVILQAADGREIRRELLKRKYIPPDLLNLGHDERNKECEVQTRVVARVKNEFLASGVTVIDSPGRNENTLLDDLVINHMKTIMPMIIYVIDGRNLLTIRDREDIRLILNQTTPENVFYVVSKIEPSDPDTDSDDDSDDDDRHISQDDDRISQHENQLKRGVYRKLCDENFLDPNVKMEECTRFHGLSAWRIKEHRRKQLTQPTRYTKAFQYFKDCLVDFAGGQLTYHIDRAAMVLAQKHRMCIDHFIDEANRIYSERESYNKVVAVVEAREKALFDDITKKITEEENALEVVIRTCLADVKPKLLQDAADYKYKPYAHKNEILLSEEDITKISNKPRSLLGVEEKAGMIQVDIPNDGFVSDGDVVKVCKLQIKQVTYEQLSSVLSRKIWDNFDREDGLLQKVWEELGKLDLKDLSSSVPTSCLKDMLVSNYSFSANKENFRITLMLKIKLALKQFFKAIASFFRGELGKTGVGTIEWKRQIASEALQQIDPVRVKNTIIGELKTHIRKGHERFVVEIAKMQQVYKTQLELGEKSRSEIRSYTPRLSTLELKAWNLVDGHCYGTPEMSRRLGTGSQGAVFAIRRPGPNGEKLAMKRVKSYSSDDPLDIISPEVHHLRQFDHPSLMKLYGCVILSADETSAAVGMIMEEMKGDMLHCMGRYSLRERLQMALQVAEALAYLHGQKLVHRDVKPANVLIGFDNIAKLTDFGCCKPFGLTHDTLVGTPIHMAPEMLGPNPKYCKAVDVYAFGIFLWYVANGSGQHPIDSKIESGVGVVFNNTVKGRRPEKKEHFRNDCWELMSKCWAAKPDDRSCMKNVCDTLENILEKCD